jgi:hypothetical protein
MGKQICDFFHKEAKVLLNLRKEQRWLLLKIAERRLKPAAMSTIPSTM